MPYDNTAAEFRPELQVKVEEALGVDNKFIADIIFPVYPVATRKGYYKKIKRGKGQLLANPGTNTVNDPLLRAPGTAYREVSRTTEQDSWLCQDRGLKEVIDDVNKQEESRFFDIESSTAIWLMRQMRIAREVRAAAEIYSTSNWGTALDFDATLWVEANIATIDPPAAFTAARLAVEKRGENPNTLVISNVLWDVVSRSTKMREFFFGDSGGNAMITSDMVAEKFMFEQILVGKASTDSTKPGKDSSDSNLSWIWSATSGADDRYFWVGQVTGGAPEMGGAGRTMVMEQLTGGQLFVTETYRDEDKRSDTIRVREDDDIKIVSEQSGILVEVN